MQFIFNRKPSKIAQYLSSIFLVTFIASLAFLAKTVIGYQVVAIILLVVVSFIAMFFEILPVLLAALLSAFIINFFFLPPVFTLHIANTEDIFMFVIYLVIALVNSVMTYRIRRTERLVREKEEKENELKLYNTLLNSLSHELRTPISTILGSVDVLKENNEKLSSATRVELLSEIEIAGLRLNRQVGNLLNMNRLESGMLKLKTDWCDINELIFSIIRKLDSNNNIHRILYTENDQLPLFKIDGGLLEQVIYNIVHNALLYTPLDATINIQIEFIDDQLKITVTDNGNGFQEKDLPLIFNKFYRSASAKTGGTGLGLSIAKGFVEAHGGTIKAENNVPKGAIITISIPAECSFINNLKNE